MNLLPLEPEEIDATGYCHLKDHRARHLLKVLMVEQGARVRAGVILGRLGEAVVEHIEGEVVHLRWEPGEKQPAQPGVDLLLALPRPKVMNRLWAQLSAIGVGRIVLTNAAKVERYYFDTHVVTPENYRPRLVEGLAQAQHTWLPEVTIHQRLKPLVEDQLDDLFGDALRILAHPAESTTLPDVVRTSSSQRIVLAVGPEGGWTPYELSLLMQNGFTAASLGPGTLRTDTACIACLSVIHSLRNPQ